MLRPLTACTAKAQKQAHRERSICRVFACRGNYFRQMKSAVVTFRVTNHDAAAA